MKGGLMEKSIKVLYYFSAIVAAVLLVSHLTTTKFQSLKQQHELYNNEAVSIHTREKQLECLAINVYREAGHEPFEGKVAVAQVTMNRVADGKFGTDVCGVVYRKNVVMDQVICQFSWACDSVHRNRPVDKAAYTESYEVAKKVLLEGFRLNSLKDALFYHAEYVNPRWSLDRVGKIGQHIFYKQKEAKL
jgi:spore germination cell wall hydrolase CwlJ-like protein